MAAPFARRSNPDARFAVFDIEARDWNEFRVAWFLTSDGEETRCDTLEKLVWCVERFPGAVFAHYGGRYDFFFLPKPRTLVLSGSGIQRAQLGSATLKDTWFLFQMSLEKIGKAVGLEKLRNKSNRIEELTDEECSEHCLNDCRVLMRALQLHRRWCLDLGHEEPRWPTTAGGTAVYALETFEPDAVAALRRDVQDLSVWLEQISSATGGRVELWQLGRVKGPVYSYDINSSYPKSWSDGLLPMGPWDRSLEVPGRLGVFKCRVQQSRDALPIVAPGHVWRYDGEAWCTSEELEAVRQLGGQVEVLDGWTSRTVGPLGQRFATEMYGGKQRGDPWSKVSINSLHGKLDMGILQSSYVTRHGRLVQDMELNFPSWYQRPLIGAFILSRARLRLAATLNALRREGWRVYYCDTDCVHTNCPPESFPGRLTDACGDWKLEAEAEEAVYAAPKVYALRLKSGKLKMASKGLPRNQVEWEHLLEASRGNRVVFHDRSGLVSFRSQGDSWGAVRAEKRRTLSRQTGGKLYGVGRFGHSGKLFYRDEFR